MKTFDDMPAANVEDGDVPVTRAEFEALKGRVDDLAAKVETDETDDSEDKGEDSSIMGAMDAKPTPPAMKQAMKKPMFGGMMKGKPPLK